MSNEENNLNTVRYVYDDIKRVVSSCVIKYDNLARANETVESKRNFDYYYIASQKLDTFDSYPSFPIHVLENAGVLDVSKLNDYVKQAKVCMTVGRKTTYCHEIWTHMELAR